MTNLQLFLALTAEIGVILGALWRLSDKVDRHYESFNNQVTTLLTTIHGVDVRVVKLEEKK
jgi:hypothetical protein